MSYPIVTPPIFPTPWATNASNLTITYPVPITSQIAIKPGAASLEDGYVLSNFQDPDFGGLPLDGQATNGILYGITAFIQNQQAGIKQKFNSAFATAVGGYPIGAIIQSDDSTAEYISITAANTTNFNTTPASIGVNWMLYSSAGKMRSVSIPLAAAPASYNFYIGTGGNNQYSTVAPAVANFGINVAWAPGKTLTSIMADNTTQIEIKYGVKMSTTAYQLTGIIIDGVSQSIAWPPGGAPTALPNKLCEYRFIITKITGGFLVQCELIQFA